MNLMEAENLFLPLDSEMKRVFDHFAIFIFYWKPKMAHTQAKKGFRSDV